MQADSMAIELKDLTFRRVDVFTSENEEAVPDEETYIRDFKKSMQTIDKLEHQLMLWISSVTLPKRLLSENIAPPTIECKNQAQATILKLYKDFSLYPIRISASIEEGIFIKYINHKNQRELSIEIYNDSEVAAIVTKYNETIVSRDIHNESFSEIYKIFYEI